jgi:predicted DNA-binding transcriptional regulator AlpA
MLPEPPNTFEQFTTRLPRLIRFRDIRAAGIVDSWESLSRLIDDHGFPSGMLLSPNVRAWDVDEISKWLATRPTERKATPAPRKHDETAAA